MKTNDLKKKNDQLTNQNPTGLMGTQFALNSAQGVLDAVEEAQVTKAQMLNWDQKKLRLLSKKATQKFLKLISRGEDGPLSVLDVGDAVHLGRNKNGLFYRYG